MRALLVVSFLVFSNAAVSGPLIISTKAGEFQSVEGADAALDGEVEATIRLTSVAAGPKWAPGAFLGFAEGAGQNHQNSIQFFLVKNKISDSHLLIGYRTIKDGAIIESVSLGMSSSLTSASTFHVSFSKGTFIVSVDSSAPVAVQTDLGKVRSYFSANSCAAEFSQIAFHTVPGEKK